MTPYIAFWPVGASLFCSSSEFSQSCLFSSLLQPLLTTLGSCSIFLPGTYLSSSISHFQHLLILLRLWGVSQEQS